MKTANCCSSSPTSATRQKNFTAPQETSSTHFLQYSTVYASKKKYAVNTLLNGEVQTAHCLEQFAPEEKCSGIVYNTSITNQSQNSATISILSGYSTQIGGHIKSLKAKISVNFEIA